MKGLFSKTTMIAFTLYLVAAVTQPVIADDVVGAADFQACRAIQGKAERLLCYDTVADGGVFNEQQLKQVQRENFGSKERETEISVDKLTVTIVSVQKGANGIHYFHTADGQAWKQQDPGKYSTQTPFEAEIKTGMMGSFFLVNEEGRGTRVKRVR